MPRGLSWSFTVFAQLQIRTLQICIFAQLKTGVAFEEIKKSVEELLLWTWLHSSGRGRWEEEEEVAAEAEDLVDI